MLRIFRRAEGDGARDDVDVDWFSPRNEGPVIAGDSRRGGAAGRVAVSWRAGAAGAGKASECPTP
jgi:hypothetical protein